MLRAAVFGLIMGMAPLVAQGQSPDYESICSSAIDNATIIVPASVNWAPGYTPAPGDTLALRTSGGGCAGWGEWTEDGAVMAAAGYDELLYEILGDDSGYEDGERLAFEVYDASEGEAISVDEVQYAPCDGWIPTEICGSGDYADGLVMKASQIGSQPLPVEVASFKVSLSGGTALLSWATASESGNSGFSVQRRGQGWEKVGFVESKHQGGNAERATKYTFRDRSVPYALNMLEYRLRQVDLDGSTDIIGPISARRETKYTKLLPPFPNPANRRITVRFSVSRPQNIELRIYTLLGRLVKTPLSRKVAEGRHEIEIGVSGSASGVYFVQMRANGFTRTQKVTILK